MNRVPFDITHAFGFYIILMLQCLSGISYMLIVSLFSGFYIGMCRYIVTCINDLFTFVIDLEETLFEENVMEKQCHIDDLLTNMLQYHADALK